MAEKDNLVMVDYSHLDPRSFKRHLAGTGDQRVRIFEQYAATHSDEDMEAFQDEFSAKAYGMLCATRVVNAAQGPRSKVSVLRQVGHVFRSTLVAAVGLMLGVMLYQVFVG